MDAKQMNLLYKCSGDGGSTGGNQGGSTGGNQSNPYNFQLIADYCI